MDPSLDSLDGPEFTGGISWYRNIENHHLLRSIALGLDVSRADTEGANYRFFGVGTYARFTHALSKKWRLDPSAGWTYRTYPDFTGDVNRDENIIRVAARIRYLLNNSCELAGVVNYDRFASENTDFDAERFLSGIVLIFRR